MARGAGVHSFAKEDRVSSIGHFLEATLVIVIALVGIGVSVNGLVAASNPQALIGLGVYLAAWAYVFVRVAGRGASHDAAAAAHGGV